ncbi:T9SS sorting signal type C domain-containing protein [Flavobacterium soyangense]|nr:T9SS sorting signal type C domain-containing protein [Flavobacterium soyangense]
MIIFSLSANAQDIIYWNSSSTNGEWDWGSGCTSAAGGNWLWTISGMGARQRPDCSASFNIIKFDNGIFPTMNLNSINDYGVNQILFINGTPDRIINTNASRGIYFQNNNGNCKIENSVAFTTHIFNVNIFINSFGNFMEINPVNGYLRFNNTVRNNSDNPINIYGAQQVTFSGDISGTPGLTINNTATVIYTGVSKTYTGTTTINAGTKLKISSNQTLGNIALNGGTLQIDTGVTLTITGTYSSTGGTIDNKGTIKFAGVSVTFPGNATVNNGIANTLTGFEVTSPAIVTLSSSLNVEGMLTVSGGGILEFNGFNIFGSGGFTLASTGTLRITSLDGVNASGNNTGNIQCTGVRTYSQSGYYHYVGSETPQNTGTAMTSGSAAKQIVINKTNATDIVYLTQSTGLSNSGGLLSIIKGVFIETSAANIYGSGNLSMNTNGTYITSVLNPTVSPQLSGTYSLTGGTIELNAFGNQILNGTPNYNNITFSKSGTKTLSGPISNISGTVTIQDSAIFDADNHSFGGADTKITMTGTSKYMLGGTTASKPESGGPYSLGPNTTFEFTGGSATNIRLSAPTITYANIIVSGTNVSNSGTVRGIKFQAGGKFTVKNGATFKLNTTAGFTGSTNTGIDTVTNGGPTITLETGSKVEYAGADQNITPFASYYNVGISGSGTKTISSSSEILVGNELTITSSTLQIDSNKLLTVTNAIKNTSGTNILIKNGGNLVQITDVDNATTNTNTGNIKMTRTSRSMIAKDYVYWGSPVQGSVLSQIPSAYDRSYMWNLDGTIDGKWVDIITTVPGRGFITRSAVDGINNFDFTGVPNNGIVKVPADSYDGTSDVTGNTILLANPYSSAIDAAKFVTDPTNDGLDGTLYFWTSSTPFSGTQYNVADYSSWNVTGGTGTKATTDVTGTENLKPTGKIAAGQGFFADIHSDFNVTFKNNMRLRTTGDNSQFFKTTKANNTVLLEKNRIWLNFSDNQNAFRQTLVGYVTGATNDIDKLYDGESYTDNEINIYSIIKDKNLVIQGRALPFEDTDLVPLGYVITNAGSYKIEIDEVDGFFVKDKNIYLEDKVLNVIYDLKNSPYAFTTESGTFNDRFVLRYTNKTLRNTDFETLKNQILVSNKNKQIKVNSVVEAINKVLIYDLLGRQIYKKENVNGNELTILNLVSIQQTLLVKVSLKNGKTVTKKIVY